MAVDPVTPQAQIPAQYTDVVLPFTPQIWQGRLMFLPPESGILGAAEDWIIDALDMHGNVTQAIEFRSAMGQTAAWHRFLQGGPSQCEEYIRFEFRATQSAIPGQRYTIRVRRPRNGSGIECRVRVSIGVPDEVPPIQDPIEPPPEDPEYYWGELERGRPTPEHETEPTQGGSAFLDQVHPPGGIPMPLPGGPTIQAEEPKLTKTCGPEATYWLAGELGRAHLFCRILQTLADEDDLVPGDGKLSFRERMAGMALIGSSLSLYKWWPPVDEWKIDGQLLSEKYGEGCASKWCRNTFQICGHCIAWSTIGNIVYGIASYELGFTLDEIVAFARIAKVKFTWIPPHTKFDEVPEEDKKAYEVGRRFAHETIYNQTDIGVLRVKLCELIEDEKDLLVLKGHKDCSPCKWGFTHRSGPLGFFTGEKMRELLDKVSGENSRKTLDAWVEKWEEREKWRTVTH